MAGEAFSDKALAVRGILSEAEFLVRLEAELQRFIAKATADAHGRVADSFRLALSWLRESIDEYLTQKAGEK